MQSKGSLAEGSERKRSVRSKASDLQIDPMRQSFKQAATDRSYQQVIAEQDDPAEADHERIPSRQSIRELAETRRNSQMGPNEEKDEKVSGPKDFSVEYQDSSMPARNEDSMAI